jgi:hypothetical protein
MDFLGMPATFRTWPAAIIVEFPNDNGWESQGSSRNSELEAIIYHNIQI